MGRPAYTRLQIDERRRQILDAGAALFAERAYEEISMREIAAASGVSKALIYHYFPRKTDLFAAAVAEAAAELERLVEPTGPGTPVEKLARSLDAYLGWIEENARAWATLIGSVATLPEARAAVEAFRARALAAVLAELTGAGEPRPALRIAVSGWLGYLDAAILDWTTARDLDREQLRQLLMAAFGAALLGARGVDPAVELRLG